MLFYSSYLYKKKDNIWKIACAVVVIFFGALFLMTDTSKLIWQHVSLLQKFQFPWRLLSVVVFVTAVAGGIFIAASQKKWRLYIVIITTILILFTNKEYWHANNYLIKPESFYTGIYNGTTDTGESAPIWSIRFMEKRPNAHMEVIEGNASIKEINRSVTNHKYEIIAKEQSRIKENTLFFPGWRVIVDGKEVPLQFQDPQQRGLMTFVISPGVHDVIVQFTETKLRFLANLTSFSSMVVIIIYLLKGRNIWKRFQ